MKAGEKFFLVTPKGVEELRGRAHKLDAGAKNILSLIEQGSTNPDAILQRSKAPRETVIDGLRWLMSHGFVATGTSDGTPSPGAHDAASVTSSISERLRLKPGISPAQARFLLTDFCLDQFGADGQVLANAVEFCTDVTSLQMALDNIRTEVKRLGPEGRAALVACVREINETDF
ncbi:MAG: hypothetical protein ACLPWG_10270 [Steroidobacteraceae bacterium]